MSIASLGNSVALSLFTWMLVMIAAEGGDADACRQLVEAFLPAIAGVARSFHSGSGVERRELLREALAQPAPAGAGAI
jgi:hypothetical protein